MRQVALLIVGFACLAPAQNSDELRNWMKVTNAKFHKALMKKDVKGFAALMKPIITKDFKYMEGGQTMTFNQMLEGMKAGMGQFTKMIKVDSKVLTVQAQGNKANVTVMHSMSGYTMGPDKKKHVMAMSGNAIESYVKMGKSWKLSSMDWRESKMTMDGKPFDPMAGGQPK